MTWSKTLQPDTAGPARLHPALVSRARRVELPARSAKSATPRPTILSTKSAPPAPATVLASCEPGPPQGVELDDYHDRLVAPKLRAGGRQTPTFRPRPQRRSGSVPKARRLPPVFLGKLVRPSSEPAAEFHNRIAGPTQR